MLYATTRSDNDTYTAERALKESCAPDGGLYIPMQWPCLKREEVLDLLSGTPGEIIACFMNLFFSCKLTGRDVEFSLGKKVLKLSAMSHRIAVAEAWHNVDGDFTWVQRVLTERTAIDKRQTPIGEWMKIATRIALLFCAYSQMMKEQNLRFGTKLDVTYPVGTFNAPMAAWYARQMGLPVGTVICCCNENNSLWELLNRGEMKTNSPIRKTNTPRCDVALPQGIERLIRAAIGREEARRYVEICQQRGTYIPGAEHHRLLQDGMYVSVVSDRRIPRVIANTYATNEYVLCPYSALMYSGLMDYRADTGRNGPALMICESSPLQCEDMVSQAMGITGSQLHQRLDITV